MYHEWRIKLQELQQWKAKKEERERMESSVDLSREEEAHKDEELRVSLSPQQQSQQLNQSLKPPKRPVAGGLSK